MALETSGATGAIGGDEYVQRLKDGREVWLRGERVDVTTHPAFSGVLGELRRLYDLQHDPAYRDQLTFLSKDTGHRIGASYLAPTNREELAAWRACAETWAEETWGLLIDTPDYMAAAVVGLYDCRNQLASGGAGDKPPRYDSLKNAEAYYRYASERDLAVAHAVADPVDQRSQLYPGYTPDPQKGLRVVEETTGGIVVSGVWPLVPMAPLAHELLVCSPAAWFATPLSAAGIKVLCTEPLSAYASDSNHPFASRFGEPDATVFLDNVFVPSDRVFHPEEARRCLDRMRAWCMYSANVRTYHYLWTLAGVGTMLAEATGSQVQRGMRDKLGEMTVYPELFRSALMGTEIEASVTAGGLMAPSSGLPLAAFAEQYSRRIIDLVREIAGAQVVLQFSEDDLNSPDLQPYIERHLASDAFEAAEKVRLFRLAWDLIGDGSGARRELYERWLRGDVMGMKNQLYLEYGREPLMDRVKDMVSRPLPQPETPPVWDLIK